MVNYVIYNGNVISDKSIFIAPFNRAFKYGDGLFESIRYAYGKVQILECHISRAKGGMLALGMKAPERFSEIYICSLIESLLLKNKIINDARIRMQIFRNGGGMYRPEDNSVSFVIQSELIIESGYKLNEHGLVVDAFYDIKKDFSPISQYKTTSSVGNILASIYMSKINLDECFLFNSEGKAVQAVSSNIFMVKNGEIYTPPVSDGCVKGVMRSRVISLCSQKIKLNEKSLSESDLLTADEIFITNAIKGIRWVGKFRDKKYSNDIAQRLIIDLNSESRRFS